MARGFRVKVSGVRATQVYLVSKAIELSKDVGKGLKEAGTFLKGEVKASIEGKRNEPRSVDTGEFRESVDMVSSNTTATIFSDVKQSKFMEYGTSRIKSRRHFNNSLDRNRSKIGEIIKNEIKI